MFLCELTIIWNVSNMSLILYSIHKQKQNIYRTTEMRFSLDDLVFYFLSFMSIDISNISLIQIILQDHSTFLIVLYFRYIIDTSTTRLQFQI